MAKLSKKLLTEYLNTHSLTITTTFNIEDIIDLDSILDIDRPKKNMTDEEIEEWINLNITPVIISSVVFGDRIDLKHLNSLEYEIN